MHPVREDVGRRSRQRPAVERPEVPEIVNPMLSPEKGELVREQCRASGLADSIPAYPSPEGIKIPAAWLVEHAGFPKGTRRGKIGISEKHALALINLGGTTRELIAFAGEILTGVERTFGIRLAIEPVIVGGNTAT